jgi:hypothetical protein
MLSRKQAKATVVPQTLRSSTVSPEIAEALHAATRNKRSVVRFNNKRIAIIPLRDLRLLERLIEEKEDQIDVEEAERRLSDPSEVPIPYDEARKRLGFESLSGGDSPQRSKRTQGASSKGRRPR